MTHTPAARRYKVVDAFSAEPFKGNPVAVVLDTQGLDDAAMQAIARWTNLSETTFVLPPTDPAADYRLRIFTPRSELPFAGHPTLGSAHAVLEAGLATPQDGVLVQQCRQGLVRIAITGETLVLDLPPATLHPIDAVDVTELEAILDHAVLRDPPPAMVDVGPVWIVAQVDSAQALLALRPDFGRSAALERKLGITGLCLFGAYPEGGPAAIEVRAFAPSSGVDEDPVCGSGNGCVAAFRAANGQIPAGGGRYLATQGRPVGRDGWIEVAVDGDGRIRIGGACVTCVDGLLRG